MSALGGFKVRFVEKWEIIIFHLGHKCNVMFSHAVILSFISNGRARTRQVLLV